MFTKYYVATQTFATDKREVLAERWREDKGEIASWMIVAAMLVGAAIYARQEIRPFLDGLIDEVAGGNGGEAAEE